MSDLSTAGSRPVLVATGMAIEAWIASGPGVETLCSGSDPDRLRMLLADTDPTRYRAVVSFGLAGGLDPALRAGDIVVAQDVNSGGRISPADGLMAEAFLSRLEGGRRIAVPGRIVGSDAIVADPAAKAALYRTGVTAVDMESHVAADWAAQHHLPFGVIRVICDPAERALPKLVDGALGNQGRIDLPAIVGSLARDPSQISSLLGTGRDFAAAVASLRRCRRLLGLSFGLADFGELLLDVP